MSACANPASMSPRLKFICEAMLLGLPSASSCSTPTVTCPRSSDLSTSPSGDLTRSEEHTSELQSQSNLVCRLLLEKKNNTAQISHSNNTKRTLFFLEAADPEYQLAPVFRSVSTCRVRSFSLHLACVSRPRPLCRVD